MPVRDPRQEYWPISDAMISVLSMASTRSTETQHRLLGLVATILGIARDKQAGDDGEGETIDIPENAEALLNSESIEQLCQGPYQRCSR